MVYYGGLLWGSTLGVYSGGLLWGPTTLGQRSLDVGARIRSFKEEGGLFWGLQCGIYDSRATDFGSGVLLTWDSTEFTVCECTVWEFTVWESTCLGRVYNLRVYSLVRSILDLGTHSLGSLGVYKSPQSRATDFGSGDQLI